MEPLSWVILIAILSSFQSWTRVLLKYVYTVSPVCGYLVQPLLFAPNLKSQCLRVSTYNRSEVDKHTHTWATQAHAWKWTHAGHRDTTQTGNRSFSSWKCLCTAMWEMQSLGTTFCLFAIPFYFFLWSFSIILSQPEAAPKFSCALVVKGFVVNVDIQRRPQHQHKNLMVHPNTQTRQRYHKKETAVQ